MLRRMVMIWCCNMSEWLEKDGWRGREGRWDGEVMREFKNELIEGLDKVVGVMLIDCRGRIRDE